MDHASFAMHHGAEAGESNIERAVLLALPDAGVHHAGLLEERRLGCAGHEAGDGDAFVFNLMAKPIGEAVNEGFCAVIDSLVGAWHEARDRSGNENAAVVAIHHIPAELMKKV